MKVLFICTGNTCRSPMAEGIFNRLSEGAFSRGIASDGSGASVNACKAMAKMGIDVTAHVSKQLTIEDIENSDLVLTMTKGHKAVVLSAVPNAGDKVFTVGEYAGGDDVSDPYGGDESVYDACAEELYGYIEKIVEKLK